jgi:hypothetical protein
VVLGKVDNKLLTLQVTLPADNQQQAQTAAENIVNTLVISNQEAASSGGRFFRHVSNNAPATSTAVSRYTIDTPDHAINSPASGPVIPATYP